MEKLLVIRRIIAADFMKAGPAIAVGHRTFSDHFSYKSKQKSVIMSVQT